MIPQEPANSRSWVVIMGGRSDSETMQHTCHTLASLNIPFEKHIVSAHRTPDWMAQYAKGAAERGLEVIVAAAGGAAHLPGMVAAHTLFPFWVFQSRAAS